MQKKRIFIIGTATLLISAPSWGIGQTQSFGNEPLIQPGAAVTLQSDNLYHGISTTNGNPSISGEVSAELVPAELTAAISGTAARYNRANDFSLVPYLYKDWMSSSIFPLATTIAYIAIIDSSQQNYFDIGQSIKVVDQIKLGLNWAPYFLGTDGTMTYVYGKYHEPLPWAMTARSRVGYSHFTEATGFDSYADFELSLERDFFDIEFKLTGALLSNEPFANSGRARAALEVTKSF